MPRAGRLGLAFLLLGGLAHAQSPAPGKFLVAARGLVDPNFRETVVLLVDYGEEGCWGLVINRPTQVPLARVFPEEKALQKRDDRLYSGGPVSPGRFLLLVRSPRPPGNSRPVFAEVHLAASPAVLRGPDAQVIADFRAYAGYAGWAPGQLEGEIARGDWYVLAAEAGAVFAADPALVWTTLHNRAFTPVARLPAQAGAADPRLLPSPGRPRRGLPPPLGRAAGKAGASSAASRS